MRFVVAMVLAGLLAWPQPVAAETGEEAPTKAALPIHATYRLPPQLMLQAGYYLYFDTGAEDTTSDQASESNLKEPVSSPAPETEMPDINTLSQRAIEHYDIHYKTRSEEQKKQERRRRRGLTIGIPIAVVTVVCVVLGTVAVSRSFE
jgi:hypothetical protein